MNSSLKPKRVYVTMLGRSVWAILNSYYCSLKYRDFQPNEIILLIEDKNTDALDELVAKTKSGLEIISSSSGIDPEIIDIRLPQLETEAKYEKIFLKTADYFLKKKEEWKQNDDIVALDITPGKKTLVAGTIFPINLADIEHVFYLNVKEAIPKPYMMIPHQYQIFNDFKKQVKRAMDEPKK
ncbi:hypothetical protein [Methanosalsum natronophilum]|uniref:hypothetical protein n=1 Tax=Methanosalsum natronophilum TaxID=768733 RepID=UPI002167DC58|nr:hypothetical protein [Methanosalsum natronophilum]MCS3924850.1 hypothetical protein [Methanosalsum natronophilum]